MEVVEEVEEPSLHLSHVRDIREKGVLQGGRLDYFAGPCWLGGPGLLLVGPVIQQTDDIMITVNLPPLFLLFSVPEGI